MQEELLEAPGSGTNAKKGNLSVWLSSYLCMRQMADPLYKDFACEWANRTQFPEAYEYFDSPGHDPEIEAELLERIEALPYATDDYETQLKALVDDSKMVLKSIDVT